MIALALLAQIALAEGRAPQRAPAAAPAPSAAAQPQPSAVVTLRYGEAVVFRPALATGEAAVIVAAGDPGRARVLQPGEVRARLEKFGQGETMLVVENMTGAFLDYQAVMTLPDGTSQPTTVCTLLPHGRQNFEHWPQMLASVTLFNFRAASQPVMSCR